MLSDSSWTRNWWRLLALGPHLVEADGSEPATSLPANRVTRYHSQTWLLMSAMQVPSYVALCLGEKIPQVVRDCEGQAKFQVPPKSGRTTSTQALVKTHVGMQCSNIQSGLCSGARESGFPPEFCCHAICHLHRPLPVMLHNLLYALLISGFTA